MERIIQKPTESAAESGGVVPQSRPRKTWTFHTPASLLAEDDSLPKAVTLRECYLDELNGILSRVKAKGNFAFEATAESLHKVDNLVVDRATFEGQSYLRKWPTKYSQLLVSAWNKLHTTSNEVDEDFFASRAEGRA